jgi:hypothetical protein
MLDIFCCGATIHPNRVLTIATLRLRQDWQTMP